MSSDDSDAVVRAVAPPPGATAPSRDQVEGAIISALASPDSVARRNAGLAAYALTQVKSEQAVSEAVFERLVAAVAVETDADAVMELLTAITVQPFSGPLRRYATLMARLIEAFVRSDAPLPPEAIGRLQYTYGKLQRQAGLELGDLKVTERALVGFAATGLLFALDDPARPQVVLVYNRKLNSWLPPGGHFDPAGNDVPTLRLLSKIRTETGAPASLWWNAPEFSENHSVQIEPSPAFVLFENLRAIATSPMEPHAYHYDFNYICTLEPGWEQLIDAGTHPCLVVDLGSLPATRKALRPRIEARMTAKAASLTDPELQQARVLPDVVERITISLLLLRDYFQNEDRASQRFWRSAYPDVEAPAAPNRDIVAGQVLGSKVRRIDRKKKLIA